MKLRKVTLLIAIGLLLCFAGLPDALAIYSENYRIDNSSVNSGGGEMSGIQDKMAAGVSGQRGFGAYSTASYKLEVGLLPATSEAAVPIVSDILTPGDKSKVYGTGWTITGSASSVNGVAFVEISTDGGKTWGTASGTGSWSYGWTLPAPGTYNIRSRATDSHNNTETPSSGINVDVIIRDGMDLAFTQAAKTVTLNATGFDKNTPMAGKTFKFYKSTYSPTTSAWSAWALLGTVTAGTNGSATKIYSMSYGTYQFKATYEPVGLPKVESAASSTCVIGLAVALSPATGAVTTDSTPPAAWNAFPGATGYVIQTCPTSKFTTGVIESTNLGNVTTGDIPALTRGVKAYWRVIALLPAGRSIPSTARYITYKEGTSFTILDAGKSGMAIRPAATLQGNASGPLAGKKVYFYYRKTGLATWSSAGSAVTGGDGTARLAAPKTLAAGSYDLKASFNGDAGYCLCDSTGSFIL